ncbi:MAG: hypothetical protein IJM59_03720 [Proteobacteria bacterium]|nr:hypothetical protein [Pseudomonadota bacterium]
MKLSKYLILGLSALAIQACSDDSGGSSCQCDSSQTCCDGKCVDLDTDSDHCGSCTNACESKEICQSGECKSTPESSCKNCKAGKECCNGKCVDLSSDHDNCGKCGKKCGKDQTCSDKVCSGSAGPVPCTPATCVDFGYSCGTVDDGCGSTLKCGTCNDDEDCIEHVCTKKGDCTPKTCGELSISCGDADDGCGGTVSCGNCEGELVCQNGQCVEASECTPKTCAELSISCGDADDGCGGTISCGNCEGELVCQSGQCVEAPVECTPKTCDDLKISCGDADNGCGGTISCGTCDEGKKCENGSCVAKCTPTNCSAEGKNCGSIPDGCGGTLDCGKCNDPQICSNNVCSSIKDTYPTRKSIKSLQPDGASIDEVAGNETHGVVMNMVWMNWQPTQTSNCSGERLYDGNCFTIGSSTENQIKEYTKRGVVVTAILWGVPDWARIPNCGSYPTVGPHFCAPAPGKEKDFGRFAGFLAHYFNGENGHGRIADFVIHNEVNNFKWFNPGYKSFSAVNIDNQADVYAKSFNAAYDYIRKEQKQAKVLISLDHFFGEPSSANGSLASMSFLKSLIPKLGEREWRLAYHSYPPNLLEPVFGPDDWKDASKRITFGTLGILAAWLRQNYPTKPYTWEIQLTENGINGYPSSRQSAQKEYLCKTFKNVLGTPGIESFVYHRLIDHPDETKDGLGCGLWNSNKNPKPAWETFALANRKNVKEGWPSCGFELLPYVEMVRGKKNNMHWVTTRQLPSGFTKEQSWKILRDKPKENSVMVYECRVGGAGGNHAMIATDVNCEGQFNMGPMGYLYKEKQSGTSAVYRCRSDSSGSHFISSDDKCEGQVTESLVGYAIKM